MKGAAWVVVAVVLATALVGLWALFGPRSRPTLYTIEQGTRVRVVLLQTVKAGTTPENADVPIALAQDLTGPSGAILLPAGTRGTARVLQSRSEGALSGMMRQPARLRLAPVRMDGPSGSVQLAPLEEEGFSVSFRDRESSQPPRDLTADQREALAELRRALEGESVDADRVAQAASALNLRAPQDEVVEAAKLLAGGVPTDIDGALRALKAVGTLVDELGGFLEGLGRGRSLHAPAGMELPAQIAETLHVPAFRSEPTGA